MRALTDAERANLLTGAGNPFENRAARVSAWQQHRETLMRAVPLGTRPEAWWSLEQHAYKPTDRKQETEKLRQMGELTDAEKNA